MRTNKHELYKKLKDEKGLLCGICGGDLIQEWELYKKYHNEAKSKSFKRTSINISIDHIFPKSQRRDVHWWSDIDNLQLVHTSCNVKKGDKIL